MTEQNFMVDILITLKALAGIYFHGTIEASDQEVHQRMEDNLKQIIKMQFETYQLMSEMGWYPEEEVSQSKINKTLKKLEGN